VKRLNEFLFTVASRLMPIWVERFLINGLSEINRVLKNSDTRLFKKVSDARRTRIDERRRTWELRQSESGERNEAGESFSTACKRRTSPFRVRWVLC